MTRATGRQQPSGRGCPRGACPARNLSRGQGPAGAIREQLAARVQRVATRPPLGRFPSLGTSRPASRGARPREARECRGPLSRRCHLVLCLVLLAYRAAPAGPRPRCPGRPRWWPSPLVRLLTVLPPDPPAVWGSPSSDWWSSWLPAPATCLPPIPLGVARFLVWRHARVLVHTRSGHASPACLRRDDDTGRAGRTVAAAPIGVG